MSEWQDELDRGWVVIRYAGKWPSHPEEDLPMDNSRVEICRGGAGVDVTGVGISRRVVIDGHESAEMADVVVKWHAERESVPRPHREGGVVWRYVAQPETPCAPCATYQHDASYHEEP